jgi:hypothetical protein
LNCSVGVFSSRDPFSKVGDYPQIEGLKTLFSVVGGDEPACCLNLLYKVAAKEGDADGENIEAWQTVDKNQVECLELDSALCEEIELALQVSSLYLSQTEGRGEKMKEFKSGFLPL